MDYSKSDQFEDIGKKLDRWYDLLWMQNNFSFINNRGFDYPGIENKQSG